MLGQVRWFLLFCLCNAGLFFFGAFIYVHVKAQLFSAYLGRGDPIEASYDYVVVGSGTAGSIVALRLAADKRNKILLLEAGPYDTSLLNIPAFLSFLQLSPVDWSYRTVPQKYSCKGLSDNVSNWPMGKIFGGSAHFNNMIYTRGHKKDFVGWFGAETDVDVDVWPYFRRSERQVGSYRNDDKFHSLHGPLVVNDLPYSTALSDAMLEAADILGYSIGDVNGDGSSAFTKPQVNILNGKRFKPSDVFGERALGNVAVLTNARVTRVRLEDGYEASGVHYKYFGAEKTVGAKKGVVLAAGVIGTPKILLQSGIGPERHLRQLGVPVRRNLMVGENLQDHITSGPDLIVLNTTLSVNAATLIKPKNVYDYFVNGEGPFTFPGCELIGFLSESESDAPDIQFMVLPVGIVSDWGMHLRSAVGLSAASWRYFEKVLRNQTISVLPILLHPKSRGTVRLRDSDPDSPPIIDPNYLSDRADVGTLISGIEHIKRFINTEPMRKLGATLNPHKFPGCERHTFDTNGYWECYLRHLTLTSYHPIGTCKMGGPDDPTSVVDYDFKVIGLNKLFVVDASAMPTLTSANINAVVAMMAEKAADAIRLSEYTSKHTSSPRNIFAPTKTCKVL